MISTEQLIQDVRKAFEHSCPNGIILGWDKNRLFSSLTKHCADCRVSNCTDFNYSYCNSFEIENNSLLQEYVYVITFKASFIVDVYSVHITRYSDDRQNGKVVMEQECVELVPTVEMIRQFATSVGFQELSDTDHNIIIDGISLELSDVATLGKCLFDDFE